MRDLTLVLVLLAASCTESKTIGAVGDAVVPDGAADLPQPVDQAHKTPDLPDPAVAMTQWAVSAGGAGEDEPDHVVVDQQGNAYVAGEAWISNPSSFGPITLTSSGTHISGFVAKVDGAGQWQWAVSPGSAIAVDSAGNGYVAGAYSGTHTFGSATLMSGDRTDAFVARLDSAGTWQAAVPAGGACSRYVAQRATNIMLDDAGNSYVVGYAQSSACFGSTTVTTTKFIDDFVAKLDSTGTWQWAIARPMGAVALDGAGDLHVAGSYSVKESFGSTTLIARSWMEPEIFVAKLGSTGDWQWATAAGPAYGPIAGASADIAVDGAGNSYITGIAGDTITFGSTTLNTKTTSVFVAKLNSAGTSWQWAVAGGGAVELSPGEKRCAISVDVAGNSYIAGDFSGTASFGATTLNSGGIFVAKLDSSGKWKWAVSAGGDWDKQVRGIAVDGQGDVFVTGTFFGSARFGRTELTSKGMSDVFVWKLRE